MLDPTRPAVILAPMEGVTDAPMRALQGETGAFSYAVSEFLRVAGHVPPKHVFLKHVPELRDACLTRTGLPVQVQLLGGDPGRMAESAVRAVECGATAIDLNFGCPANTVNRHDGGATLLKYPSRIRDIVRAVRDALPAGIPVSAKMRLGWDSIEPIRENATMAAEGGANWIAIHGRTRVAGYAPPVFWEPIDRIRESLGIPVIANGDIWNLDDFRRCRDATGCLHYMLGRGALADPDLSHRVAAELGIVTADAPPPWSWPGLLSGLMRWSRLLLEHPPENGIRRMKQWLKTAATVGTFDRFDDVKRCENEDELLAAVSHGTAFTSLPNRGTLSVSPA